AAQQCHRLTRHEFTLMKRYLAQGMIPASQAAKLARSARPGIRPGQQTHVLTHEAETTAKRMQAALERFHETAADQELQKLLVAYSGIAVLRYVILPYAHEIGERWANQHMTSPKSTSHRTSCHPGYCHSPAGGIAASDRWRCLPARQVTTTPWR
ncbi:MAG: hypothetical protein ACRDK8_10245, partial [Solirubrobacteraceae bacterium]